MSNNYDVTVIIDCARTVTVETDSPQDAIDIAYDEVGSPTLCYHCAGEIEIGDPVRAMVFDGEGEQVADDGAEAREISQLKAKIAELEERLTAALADEDTP